MINSYAEEVERWRAGRLDRLTGPEGWLSLVGLAWLDEGPNPVGSDPSNSIVLPRGPGRLGSIDLHDGAVSARFASDGAVDVDGSPGATDVQLATDREGNPTKLRLGTLVFYVIEREGRLAVRTKDAESPARWSFRGIEHWPVDLQWRVEAEFRPHEAGATVLAPDVLGTGQTYANPGALAFELNGAACRLEAFQESDEDDLFVVFGDRTNQDETFVGGRYLYAAPPDDAGTVVLDFNRAYNPPASSRRTRRASCRCRRITSASGSRRGRSDTGETSNELRHDGARRHPRDRQRRSPVLPVVPDAEPAQPGEVRQAVWIHPTWMT